MTPDGPSEAKVNPKYRSVPVSCRPNWLKESCPSTRNLGQVRVSGIAP